MARSQHGPTGISWALENDDQLETLLRQLASAREFKATGDTRAADRILAVQPPGGSVLPTWLADESRAHSTAICKQGLRNRGDRGQKGERVERGEKGAGKARGKGT